MLEKAALEYGDRVGFVSRHQDVRKTFRELREESDKVAAGLLTLGLVRGDRLGVLGPDSYEWYLTWLAATKLGIILVSLWCCPKHPTY